MMHWLELFFFLWSLASGLLLLYGILRWRDNAPLLRQVNAIRWPWGAIDVVVAYMAMAFATAVAVLVAQACTANTPVPSSPQGIGAILPGIQFFAEAAAILGVIGYLCFRYGRRPIRQFSLAHNEPLKGESNASFPAWLSRHEWTFALLVGIVCIPLILRVQILATMIVAYQHPTLEGLRQSKDSFLMFGLAARAIVTAPIFEEFLYRGLIQGGLQRINRRLNPPVESLLMGDDPRLSALLGTKANLNESPPATWPIFVSSAIFAAAHWNLGASCIPLFLFGLVLGFLFRRSGNLVSCILVHAMLNSYSIALVLLR